MLSLSLSGMAKSACVYFLLPIYIFVLARHTNGETTPPIHTVTWIDNDNDKDDDTNRTKKFVVKNITRNII